MLNKFWNDLTEATLKPAQELTELLSKQAEELGRRNLALASDCATWGVEHAQRLAAVRKVEDLTSVNSQLVSDASSKLSTYTRDVVDSAVRTSTSYQKLAEQYVGQAVQKATEQTKARK